MKHFVSVDMAEDGENVCVLIAGEISDDGVLTIHTEIIGDTPDKELQIREIVKLENML